MYNIKNNINKSMIENRRKFFKIAGWTGSGLLLWNFFPKSIFAKSTKFINDTKVKVSIHPNAISRKESK